MSRSELIVGSLHVRAASQPASPPTRSARRARPDDSAIPRDLQTSAKSHRESEGDAESLLSARGVEETTTD
eukprot:scaffold86695_cov36-Tisochrysis_lutea.AAC.1